MKTYKIKLFILALATIAFSGCIDHLLTEEELPNPDVAFTYSIIDETFNDTTPIARHGGSCNDIMQ